MKKFIYTFLILLVCFISVFSFSVKSFAKALGGDTFVYTISSNPIKDGSRYYYISSIEHDVAIGAGDTYILRKANQSTTTLKNWPDGLAGSSASSSNNLTKTSSSKFVFSNNADNINYIIVHWPYTNNYKYSIIFYSTSSFSVSHSITNTKVSGEFVNIEPMNFNSVSTTLNGNTLYFYNFSFYIPYTVSSITPDSSYFVSFGNSSIGLKKEFLFDLYNGIVADPNEPGGKPDNALFDGNLGNFSNVQKHTVTKTEDYRNTGLGATIPTNYYWQFGWDKKTNLDYLLSDYYVGIKFVCDVGVPNGNGGFTYTTNYTNGWNYFEKHATYSQAISQKYIISNYCSTHNITYDPDTVMAYSIKNIRFYLKPVIKHDNKYYYGGSTLVQFSSAGDGYNNVKTENVINPDDTDNPNRPSADQFGTGSDTHKHGYTDDSFSSGIDDFNSNLKTDLSGIRQATDEILESIKGIPQIFNSIFGWLPSWVISMFAWLIGFIILCIAISLIIKVVT